jgi:hypothetical protein
MKTACGCSLPGNDQTGEIMTVLWKGGFEVNTNFFHFPVGTRLVFTMITGCCFSNYFGAVE